MDIETTIRALTGRGFAVQHFATAAEAADYLDGAIDGTTVGIGGSKTIDQLGLYDRLTGHNTVWWHWRTPGFATSRQRADRARVSQQQRQRHHRRRPDPQHRRSRQPASLPWSTASARQCTSSRANKICPDFDSLLARATPPPCRTCSAFGRRPAVPRIQSAVSTAPQKSRGCNALLVLWGQMMDMAKVEVVLIDEPLGL